MADEKKPLRTANKHPIGKELLDRAVGAFKVITGGQQAIVDDGKGWMGPNNPITPAVVAAQQESVVGRQFDFPVGYNTRMRPRSEENVTFDQMRALADACDVLRIVIETRKDQISKMTFSVKPKDKDKEPDDRCQEVQEFLAFPDGQNSWDSWLRQIMEELFVTDAVTIYPWMKNGGTPYRFELMDGATIKRVLDERGRTPEPPLPAYQQILKGVPVCNYTRDELIYNPRNKRVHKVYGYSPVEQIIMTVNIAIRRALHQMEYYTEGSVPDLLFQCPPEWQMTQIKEFNDWWNEHLAGNTAERRKAQFVPNGVTPVNTKDAILKDPYDEWLARVVCYAFSVSPQPFIKEMNRATAGTQKELAMEEGLMPIMAWLKDLLNLLIWKYFNYKDIQVVWDEDDALSPVDQNKIDDTNLKNGSATLNEVRARRGEEPIDGGDVAMVLTATGYVPAKYEEPPEPGLMPPDPNAPVPSGVQPKPGEPAVPVDENGKNIKAPGEQAADGAKKGAVAKRDTSKKAISTIDRESKKHKKIRKALAKGIYTIFQAQAKKLASIVVNKVAKADDDILDNSEWGDWEQFNDLFGEQLAASAKLGVTQAYVQIDYDNPAALELANEDAIAYSKQRSAELVGRQINEDGDLVENPDSDYSIDDATRDMLQNDVTTSMEEGWSNDQLASALEDNYAFSEERAMTIARTETAFADTNGNMAVYQRSGVIGSKQWIVGAECCDECAELDGEVVGLYEEFSNGTDAPPAHPNCRCDFIPIFDDDSEDNAEE